MSQLTISELIDLLRECAGDTSRLRGDILDVAFDDLEYDSLAILQITGRIEREYAVTLDEDAVSEAETPREYLDLVNGALSERVGES